MDREEIATLFRNYRWMVKRRDLLWETSLDNRPLLREKLVATYGIESIMPKGSSGISLEELEGIDRRELEFIRKKDVFSEKIAFVESTEALFHNDLKLFEARNCMLEKKTIKEIADILDCSESTAKRHRDEVIEIVLRMNNVNVLTEKDDVTTNLLS